MRMDQVGCYLAVLSMQTHIYPEVDFQVTYTDDEGDEIY